MFGLTQIAHNATCFDLLPNPPDSIILPPLPIVVLIYIYIFLHSHFLFAWQVGVLLEHTVGNLDPLYIVSIVPNGLEIPRLV